MTDPADFLDEPVLPTDRPGDVKTFREMLDEAVITARAGDADYAHVLLDDVMGHLGRRIHDRDTRITELETGLDLACFHRDTDHMAAIRSLEDRLERARRRGSFAASELARERAQRETAQDYRNARARHAVADVIAAATHHTISEEDAEEWTEAVMDAIREAMP